MSNLVLSRSEDVLQPLPLAEWEDTKNTLHRYLQIVGKIRMALTPHMNHWWNVTLYLTPRGLTTGPIPHGEGAFSIDFDFVDHRLRVAGSSGAQDGFSLHDGLSVAQFHEHLLTILHRLGVHPDILSRPYDLTPP